jgi:hypothetical protein
LFVQTVVLLGFVLQIQKPIDRVRRYHSFHLAGFLRVTENEVRSMKRILKSLFSILITLLFASTSLAQGGYHLSWWTADGGGGQSSGGGYTLTGTIGQLDAGTVSGGGYSLTGGFWSGSPADSPEVRPIYLPIVLKMS